MISHDRGKRRTPRSKRLTKVKRLSLERSEIEARLKELDYFLASLENRKPMFGEHPRSTLLSSPFGRYPCNVGSRTDAGGKEE